jgi:hypothetical protein
MIHRLISWLVPIAQLGESHLLPCMLEYYGLSTACHLANDTVARLCCCVYLFSSMAYEINTMVVVRNCFTFWIRV